MADIISLRDLEVWARLEIDPADPFARAVISAASLVVTEACGHPEWDRTTVPPRAALIASQLAKRTYLNPDAVTREQIGPLGESRLEDFARTLELTPAEAEACAQMRPDGGVAHEMFVMNLGGATGLTDDAIYLYDEAGTPILYATEGDTGF